MMVPRAYSAAPFGSSPPGQYDEKKKLPQQARLKEAPARRKKDSYLTTTPPRTHSASSLESQTSPPSSRPSSYRLRLQPSRPETTTGVSQDITRTHSNAQPLGSRQSAQDVLAATAVPIRSKPRQRPHRRLPEHHVSDFSRLLQDDVKEGRAGSISSSLGNPSFHSLFGHIDGLMEGEMIVWSEGADAGILTTRSTSTASIASLASPEDFSSADNASLSPSMSTVQSSPKIRRLPRSESCEEEHPLMQLTSDEVPFPEVSMSPPGRKNTPRPPKPNAFKSNLTASLKAIKSAAQSVSTYTTSTTIQPDEFLSHSVFDIQPSMTDDHRPPPSDGTPSPALRRYLNPDYPHRPDSPTQLHFWLDDRFTPTTQASSQDSTGSFKPLIKRKYLKDNKGKPASGTRRSPIVPLTTCIPSSVRTAHASSPPIWLTPEGTPSSKRTGEQFTGLSDEAFAAFGGLKQREPRENRDFLRVFVCEMQMRRHGKLAEGAEGKARMWLPPVEDKVDRNRNEQVKVISHAEKRTVEMVRWRSWSADEL